MFYLYILSVDSLRKVHFSLKKVIIGPKRSDYHLTKELSFDILSLANQFYQSKSSNSSGLEQKKIFFLENGIPKVIKQNKKYLYQAIKMYKNFVEKNNILYPAIFEKDLELSK